MGPRDSSFKPSHEPLHGAFGRDYPRDLGYHVQMRDLHHARGGASGHYADRGSKSGGDEERGRERERYNERDRITKIKTFSVAETATEIEAETMAATETGSTR